MPDDLLRQILASTAIEPARSAAALEYAVRDRGRRSRALRRRATVSCPLLGAFIALLIGPGMPDRWMPSDSRSPAANAETPAPTASPTSKQVHP